MRASRHCFYWPSCRRRGVAAAKGADRTAVLGIARQYLPPDLSRSLPALASGYARQIVGSDVVLVSIATGLIMDIIRGAIRG